VRFGIHHSSWLDTPDPAEAFETVRAKAQWAEEHGFVWFSVMDHMIQIPRVGAPDEPVLEGWAVLAGLAAVTTRIRLATLCTAVGYRNPAHLAKITASIDLISRGRLTLGIGAGFFEAEYRQYGWEFPPRPATRIRQMEEAVELILKMWTEPRTTFHGRYFHVEDAILEPKPVQKPRPPVMIAGGGEQMTLRAVARLADACRPGASCCAMPPGSCSAPTSGAIRTSARRPGDVTAVSARRPGRAPAASAARSRRVARSRRRPCRACAGAPGRGLGSAPVDRWFGGGGRPSSSSAR
jgi:alkanesulfonate monooxygenase SsuD/methylene tetrahydromethanopterin reductase-like flavin-dependent oxidoreductase (luciferase family)